MVEWMQKKDKHHRKCLKSKDMLRKVVLGEWNVEILEGQKAKDYDTPLSVEFGQ